MRAAAGQSSAPSGASRIRSRVALSCPRLVLVRLADLRPVALGGALALGDLLGTGAFGANADGRLLLLGGDDGEAHLALLVALGGVDDDGGAGCELLAQDEV